MTDDQPTIFEIALPAAEVGTPPSNQPQPSAAETPKEDVRQQLRAQFEVWLDRMLAGEAPPEGLPPELLAQTTAPQSGEEADLYQVFTALTGLTGEIRLQGRAFKQLSEAITPLAEAPSRLKELEDSQHATLEQITTLVEDALAPDAQESALPSAKESLAVLLDMVDRLERGLRAFDAAVEALGSRPPSWRQRLLGTPPDTNLNAAINAMREGYEMTLSRLHAAFTQWEIERIGAPGELFDPTRMAAIDVESTSAGPAGTVLEVYRSGYELHGAVIVTAQVKVAKAPGNGAAS